MKTRDKIEELLDDAEDALDEGDPGTAIELCDQALVLDKEHPGAHFVRGDALRSIGELEEAELACTVAGARAPRPRAASWAALALTQYELLQFEAAERSVSRTLHEDAMHPEGWWVRSLLQERQGDVLGAHRSLVHARWLDPVGFPLPPRLDDDQVEQIVTEAISELHPTLQEYLKNVAIMLEEVPDDDILRQYDPPASPRELLGYFSGHSLIERSESDPWSGLRNDRAYRRNLGAARSHGELVHGLGSLFHEVGRFLGLDEEDLEEQASIDIAIGAQYRPPDWGSSVGRAGFEC